MGHDASAPWLFYAIFKKGVDFCLGVYYIMSRRIVR
nr:MAG TPA: hypothetical protein [Caudoviricetes sp.]